MEALDIVGASVLTPEHRGSIDIGQVDIHDGLLLRAVVFDQCKHCAVYDATGVECICGNAIMWEKYDGST